MTLATRAVIVATLALALTAMLGLADPPATVGEDAIEKTRLEKMLSDGDTGMITAVFKRHPGRILPFIDSYFEGGLAMIEKTPGSEADGGASKALESFRTGIKFAKLADEAFRNETAFSEYANAFASWSPTEQKAFREGQRLFKEGMKAAKSDPEHPEKAIDPLRRSLKLAESLGDLWGQAMAQSGLAELLLKPGSAGDAGKAHIAAMWAVELNGRLKLQEDYVQSLRLAAKAREALGAKEAAMQSLTEAWNTANNDASIDAALRQAVLDEYLAALERNGQKSEAERLRKEQTK